MELRLMKTESERQHLCPTDGSRRARNTGWASGDTAIGTGPGALVLRQIVRVCSSMLVNRSNEDVGYSRCTISNTIPQSYPRPDLTHYPAWSVYGSAASCGRFRRVLESSPGAARDYLRATNGASDARVPDRKARGMARCSYTQTHFTKPCEPVVVPFGHGVSNTGEPIWMQPMVLEGDALQT